MNSAKKSLPVLFLLLVTTLFGNLTVIAEESVNSVARKQIVELLPQDFKPAFTRETVIKLNAIVHRSFDAINEYDSSVKNIREAVIESSQPEASEVTKEMAQKKLNQLDSLMKKSKAALSDMMTAKAELENSNEEYNKAILAGMVDFVEDVEREISTQNMKMQSLEKATS